MFRGVVSAVAVLIMLLALIGVAGCAGEALPTEPSLVVLESEHTPSPTTDTAPTPLPATRVPSPQPTATPSLTPGLGCLTGRALTIGTGSAIPGTRFYLAPALGDKEPRPPVMYAGPDPKQGHVPGTSGDHGEVDLREVPPGRYYLAMWAPYDWVLAVAARDDETPLLINIESGSCTELGEIWFPWP